MLSLKALSAIGTLISSFTPPFYTTLTLKALIWVDRLVFVTVEGLCAHIL